jgi:hypothetical protein
VTGSKHILLSFCTRYVLHFSARLTGEVLLGSQPGAPPAEASETFPYLLRRCTVTPLSVVVLSQGGCGPVGARRLTDSSPPTSSGVLL